MTLLPCALLLCVSFVCASLPNLNDTYIHTLDASDCPSGNNTRTLWDILLSCGLTLFACTWTAIHTNIPGMDEGKFAITSRRLFIMVTALMAPELIITWATRQFFSARAAAKEFNDEFDTQRTQTHADDRDVSESTATLLNDIPGESGSPSAPKPTKFRRWTITHGFFVWMGGFMLYVNGKPRATLTPDELRCFIREGFVDMPVISEAEIEDRSKGDGLSKCIAILQLAWFVVQLVAPALTCVPYGLWWKKPKGVGCPYIVQWKATTSPSDLAYDNAELISEEGCCSYGARLHDFLVSLTGSHVLISPSAVHARRVPSLGGYRESHVAITLLIGCSSGMVFGVVHYLGWNYSFPLLIVWRVYVIMMTCMPVIFLLTVGFGMWLGDDNVVRKKMFSMGLLSVIGYFLLRMIVIIFTMMSLQSWPPGVYDTVAWTEYIPHL
ncbi:hypothetical protein EDB19DRAFT_1960059, partial [Suillus lakei]